MFEADWHVGTASIYRQKIKPEANKTSASAGFKTDPKPLSDDKLPATAPQPTFAISTLKQKPEALL